MGAWHDTPTRRSSTAPSASSGTPTSPATAKALVMAAHALPSRAVRRDVPEWARTRPVTVSIQSARQSARQSATAASYPAPPRALASETADSRGFASVTVNLACVFALTVLACGNLVGAYDHPIAWAISVLTATACGCLPAICSSVFRRASRSKPVIRWMATLAFMMLCQFLIGPALVFPGVTGDTAAFAVGTITQRWNQLLASYKFLISATPPVGTDAMSLPAVWTMALWCALAASSAALSRIAGFGVAPAIPILVTFALSALLGTKDGWHAGLLGAAAIAVLLPWTAARCGWRRPRRWLASLLVLTLALGAGLGSCRLMPHHRFVLRDHYEPPLIMRDTTSPLAGMRTFVKEHRNDTILTAYDLPAATPVRMAVMTCFDGNVWNVAGCADERGTATYRVMGSGASDTAKYDTAKSSTAKSDTTAYGAETGTASGNGTTVTFAIGKGLSGQSWLPVAGTPNGITMQGHADRRNLFYSAETNAAIYPTGMEEGMVYTVGTMLHPIPKNTDIAAAVGAEATVSSADSVPREIGALASGISGGQTTGGAMALALSTWLHSEGWFSHGLQGEHPSMAGHGSHRLLSMLQGSGMVGDGEQYASLMALMARELGLPSRVVLGVIPKDGNGMLSSTRAKQIDGHTVTEFTGNDIEAWVEIELERFGWVPFFPTPKETKTPDESQDLTPTSVESPLVRSSPSLADPLREERDPPDQAQQREQNTPASEKPRAWHAFLRIAGVVALCLGPVWLVGIAAGSALLYNAFRVRRARRIPVPRLCMAAGWRMLVEHLRHTDLADVPLNRTRRMQASIIERQCPAIAGMVRQLADAADTAAFADAQATATDAVAYWRQLDQVRSAASASLTPAHRWLALTTPLPLRPQRFARSVAQRLRRPAAQSRIVQAQRRGFRTRRQANATKHADKRRQAPDKHRQTNGISGHGMHP